MIEVVAASSTAELAWIRELLIEYAGWLNIDLCFQDFQTELATLPGKYAPPAGALYLAMQSAAPVGCVGVRALDAAHCEMKRLYMRPVRRGQGLGRRLATAAIDAGRAMGYRAMRLDTLHRMTEANRLYESLGFHDIPPYYSNPHEGVRYLELRF